MLWQSLTRTLKSNPVVGSAKRICRKEVANVFAYPEKPFIRPGGGRVLLNPVSALLGSVRVVHNNDDIGPMLQRCYPGSRKGHD